MIEITDRIINSLPYQEETTTLIKEASHYIAQFKWCKKINKIWFDRGWGSMLTVFYFEIEPLTKETDKNFWVIVGDLPPAYIDIYGAKNGAQALQCYVQIMDDWINAIEKSGNISDCYPVNASPTQEHADMLKSRIDFIKTEILPDFKSELVI